MTKQKAQEEDFIEDPATGRRWPLVVEIVDGDPVRGFYVGEPHKSSFVRIETIGDKRGVTDRLKRQVRAEVATQAALREAYKHPLVPSKRPTKPRAKQTPAPAWGTLDWYRNELAMAQDRIRLLESERDALLTEKRERDPVVQYVIEEPSKRASRPRKRPSPYAAEFQQWIREAAKLLALSPYADDKELATAIRKQTRTEAAARYIAEWIPHNRIAIEDLAIRLREKAATRGDVGNRTRNPRRAASR